MKANLCEGRSRPSPSIAVRSETYVTEYLFKTCFYKEGREERRNVGRRERRREKRKREKELTLSGLLPPVLPLGTVQCCTADMRTRAGCPYAGCWRRGCWRDERRAARPSPGARPWTRPAHH